jgi:hypothetical protein
VASHSTVDLAYARSASQPSGDWSDPVGEPPPPDPAPAPGSGAGPGPGRRQPAPEGRLAVAKMVGVNHGLGCLVLGRSERSSLLRLADVVAPVAVTATTDPDPPTPPACETQASTAEARRDLRQPTDCKRCACREREEPAGLRSRLMIGRPESRGFGSPGPASGAKAGSGLRWVVRELAASSEAGCGPEVRAPCNDGSPQTAVAGESREAQALEERSTLSSELVRPALP